jgi:hypothetical protein
MLPTDDTPGGGSASPAKRNTAPGSDKASNGEVVPENEDDVSRGEAPEPRARRGAEPTGLTHVQPSTSADDRTSSD